MHTVIPLVHKWRHHIRLHISHVIDAMESILLSGVENFQWKKIFPRLKSCIDYSKLNTMFLKKTYTVVHFSYYCM
jgi:hypothetical protein